MRNENYIVVQGWMINELNLKGNELLVYAVIYGFSQNEQKYSGSLQYLADWTNSTKQGVIKNLQSLVEKGLILKNEVMINNVKFCEYHTTEFNGVLNKVEQGIKQSLTGGIKQSLPNNIDINNSNNKKDIYIDTLNSLHSEKIKIAMQDFIKFRKLIKKPLTERALQLNIKKLFELSTDEDEIVDIINQTIEHGWQTFYPLKNGNNNTESRRAF